MKRGKTKTAVGILLLLYYYVKDILLLGWEFSNIVSLVVILICVYAIIISFRH